MKLKKKSLGLILSWSFSGPSQSPFPIQQVSQGYGMPGQLGYNNPVPAKAPMPPGPGLYNAVPPVSSYQSGPVPHMPVRPPMGAPSPMPPGPTIPASQNSVLPPPTASTNSFYPSTQNPSPSSWNYGVRPPMGMAGTPPPGNHVTSSSSPSPVPNLHSQGFGAPPPTGPALTPNASGPPGPPLPPTSLNSWAPPGKKSWGSGKWCPLLLCVYMWEWWCVCVLDWNCVLVELFTPIDWLTIPV